jgi:hypothetical protein
VNSDRQCPQKKVRTSFPIYSTNNLIAVNLIAPADQLIRPITQDNSK